MLFQKRCRVIELHQIADEQFSIVFDCPDIASKVIAGQFVHITCGDGLLLRRPISICDLDGGLVKLVFEAKGSGTTWLSKRRQGDELDVMGPLGKGFDLSGNNLLLVGGGIGVPPLLLAARQSKAKGITTEAMLGFAGSHKAVLIPEFAATCNSVEISSDDGSLGRHGYVTDLLSSRLEGCKYDSILACGPKEMLSVVARIADSCNIPCQVSMEQRMGCGIGACLVCSCRVKGPAGEGTEKEGYARVCADGPVFSSKEVIWDEA